MKKIAIDEFENIKGLGCPTFSKDGKAFAFSVGMINKEEDSYESYIYVKKENCEPFKLTSFGKEGTFQFIDNENIIFSGNRKPKEGEFGSKYYNININGGEAFEYLNFPINVYKIEPLKNGDYICLANNDPKCLNSTLIESKEKKDEYLKEMKDNKDYEIFDEVPFYFNGSGFTKSMKSTLYYYHTNDKKLEELTNIDYNVNSFFINKNEDIIYFTANVSKHYIDFEKDNAYAIDLKTKKIEKLISSEEIILGIVGAYKDGFMFVGHHKEAGINTDGDFYYYDYNAKKYNLLAKHGQSLWNSVGSDVRIGGGRGDKITDGGALYFISTRFDSANLYKLENGNITPVIEKDGSIESFDIYEDRIMFVGMYDMKCQELYEYKNGIITQITHFNDYLKDYYVSIPESVIFKSDKDDIHGFIMKPYEYDSNKKYPVILDIHGGPKTVYGKVFYHEMQYWASEGYFVIYCNPTGSDGRGNEFADIRGKYGMQDFKDIMNFTEYVLSLYPQMDASHVYETGGSYGGFMTNWIIGHTNRFKACASQRSISNFVSFYGTSDIGISFGFDQAGGTPWKDIDVMWEHSPLKYASNATTPTLFIHSNEDYRCPIEQGYQMYSALIYHGVDSKLVYFKGENHELSRHGKPSHRIKRLKEITEWFESHK